MFLHNPPVRLHTTLLFFSVMFLFTDIKYLLYFNMFLILVMGRLGTAAAAGSAVTVTAAGAGTWLLAPGSELLRLLLLVLLPAAGSLPLKSSVRF